MAVLPGVIRQNGYVVKDLDRAIRHWVDTLGVGPWLVLADMTLENFSCRGRPTAPVISAAFANSGPLQIELIEQHNDAPSAYREFLDAGREGLHHNAWWTDDFDAVAAGARAEGWELAQYGEAAGTRYAYYDTEHHPGTIAELMELTDATRWLDGEVRDAAEEWDGTTDPVRRLG